jgi:hypothetical protein
MKIQMHRLSLQQIPVDLFADPDGTWSYESLVSAAGLDPDAVPPPIVAALAEPWGGHPEGAAVVAGAAESDTVVAIIECEAPGLAEALGRAA